MRPFSQCDPRKVPDLVSQTYPEGELSALNVDRLDALFRQYLPSQ